MRHIGQEGGFQAVKLLEFLGAFLEFFVKPQVLDMPAQLLCNSRDDLGRPIGMGGRINRQFTDGFIAHNQRIF